MNYYVSPSGDDEHNNGKTKTTPFRTIRRGLRGASPAPASKLQPGDTLILLGGTYVEPVNILKQVGTPGNEITIRSADGQRAVIDCRIDNPGVWEPAATVDADALPDEWVWKGAEPFASDVKPDRGAFLDAPYRRLVTYSALQDFRSNNQTFGKLFDVDPFQPKRGPYKVTDESFVPLTEGGYEYTYPWVYMGPGLYLFEDTDDTNRVHVRLSHTSLNIPGVEDYLGPTDPNVAGIAICDSKVPAMTIVNSSHLVLSNLTIRFGGINTIVMNHCHFITFDGVDLWATQRGIAFGEVTNAKFRNCRFDGGLPPWFFRTDRKDEYHCLLTDTGLEHFHDNLGKDTVDVLMYGQGTNKQDFEIEHCEFVNGHDLYLVAANTNFHHNWIDNFDDEGLVLDSVPSACGWIHSNVITRCLSAISMAGGVTAGPWSIYRNLIDLRQPTAGKRPQSDTDIDVFRFGNTFKSNESPDPDGPFDLFQNTFLVTRQHDQATYLHYASDLSPHLRRSFNNIFVAVNPPGTNSDKAITFLPTPVFPGPTDGNLYHRFGEQNHVAFRARRYDLDDIHYDAMNYANLEDFYGSLHFEQSKTQYAPGYEANSKLADPKFRNIAPDGSFGPMDDLRMRATSPGWSIAVTLPSDLQALDAADEALNQPAALPSPQPQPAGCYRRGNKRLMVGVQGRRKFPGI